MKNIFYLFLISFSFIIFNTNTNAQWTNYNTGNSGIAGDAVYALATQSDGRVWIGDGFNGVSEFDAGAWAVYNTGNSSLPINGILGLEIAPNGDKWIATNTEGIAVFDDINWTIYNSANTGHNINFLQGTISFNTNGDAWIGLNSSGGALLKFDGSTWALYDINNSNIQQGWSLHFSTEDYETFWSTLVVSGVDRYLYSFNVSTGDTASYLIPGGYNWTEVFDLDFDSQGNLWIITLDGLFKFDGVDWTHFHTSNSNIPANDLRVLLIDSNDDLWLGTFGAGTIAGDGLIKYDGSVFTQWTMNNSGLPHYSFTALEEDIFGNLWIGHNGGGATVFEGAIVSVDDQESNPLSEFQLYNNYPNPFNPTTKIKFSLPVSSFVSIKVFDALGSEVTELVSEELAQGEYSVDFNASGLSSGIYFYSLISENFTETKKMILLR